MVTLYYFISSAKDPKEICEIYKEAGEKVYEGKIKDISKEMLIDTYVSEWSTAQGMMQIIILAGKYSIINE